MPQAVFRLDSSFEIGSGHVYRCLVLAEEFRRRGQQCLFVCKDLGGNFMPLIQSKGFIVKSLDPYLNQEQDAQRCLTLANSSQDIFIVDNYSLDQEFEKWLVSTHRVLAIDDLLNRNHICQTYLDQNFRSDYQSHPAHRIKKVEKKFLGPQYALIRSSLFPFRIRKKTPENNLQGLTFFGGSDPTGETLRFLLSCQKLILPNITLDVVVSNGNPFLKKILDINPPPWIKILRQPNNFDALLANADFYYGSGGSITWERMYLGLCGYTLSIAENQVELSRELANAGYGEYLGSCFDLEYAASFTKVCADLDVEKLNALSKKCQTLVDGEGSRRIVNSLLDEVS